MKRNIVSLYVRRYILLLLWVFCDDVHLHVTPYDHRGHDYEQIIFFPIEKQQRIQLQHKGVQKDSRKLRFLHQTEDVLMLLLILT